MSFDTSKAKYDDNDDDDDDDDDDLITGKQCSVRPTESQAHWIRGP